LNPKNKVKVATLAAVILAVAIVVASGINNKEYQTTIFAMDTVMNIKAYGSHAEEGINNAVEEIYRIEKIFSVTDENSDISRINHNAGSWVEVSEECVELIRDACSISEKTNGALDVTVYPIVLAWGFTTESFNVPSQDTICSKLSLVDYSRIETDGNQVRIETGQLIDLGAVTKGYTADRVAKVLKENGVKSAIINLGGNVMTIGTSSSGCWNIGIKNPFYQSELLGVVSITDKQAAVVTSGNYERYFEKDGVRYGHIINPDTGYPADSGVSSVTIISKDSTLADELSTACYILGLEKTEALRKECNNFDYVIVTTDGEVMVSEGVNFTLQ